MCEGTGCEFCMDGQFRLAQCGRAYTREIARAINIAADEHFLPVAGGLLDQSAWFLDLRAALHGEQNKIDRERIERG